MTARSMRSGISRIDRVDDDGAAGVAGLSGDRLRGVVTLWKRALREIPARFGGWSMRPTITPGADVLLRCDGTAPLHEVIAFVRGDQLVVHRVVGISRRWGWVLTRGDAVAVPDLPIVDRDLVVGRITKIRDGEHFVDVRTAPDSFVRRMTLAVCLAALAISPRSGALVIGALAFLRRPLVLAPRLMAARLRRGAGAARPPDDPSRGRSEDTVR